MAWRFKQGYALVVHGRRRVWFRESQCFSWNFSKELVPNPKSWNPISWHMQKLHRPTPSRWKFPERLIRQCWKVIAQWSLFSVALGVRRGKPRSCWPAAPRRRRRRSRYESATARTASVVNFNFVNLCLHNSNTAPKLGILRLQLSCCVSYSSALRSLRAFALHRETHTKSPASTISSFRIFHWGRF